MKKLLLFPFLFITLIVCAQSFEGTIVWTMKYEINDPAKKAQMEKGQQSMNDPANQAKLKQLQDQMNTPQMKAMMDANPQMKATMEKRMSMLQGGGDGMGVMAPKTITIKIKGNNTITKIQGGMPNTETLYMGDKKQRYYLDTVAKTFTAVKPDSMMGMQRPGASQPAATVTKTGDVMKIMNYNCSKYIVAMVSNSGDSINQVYWTTTEMKGLDIKSMQGQRMANGAQSFSFKGMEGVPLRIETNTKQANMVMEMTDIKKESYPAADFTIPADYKESMGNGQ